MATLRKNSPLPVVAGALVLLVILFMVLYYAAGPGGEQAAPPQAATPRYPGEPVSGEPVKTASGLMWYDLKVGTGKSPKPTDTVRVHYTGWLANGKEFGSSVGTGKPLEMPLSGFIKGWSEGVASMKVGGKRKLIIPSELGYGPRGNDRIPPNATLIFDVELLAILD